MAIQKQTGLAERKQIISNFLLDPRRIAQLNSVLPKVGITPQRIVQVMFNAMTVNPRLLECDATTLFRALIQVASLGLEPNTPLGLAYMIPFRNNNKGITEVQVIIGYKGFIALARRSHEIETIFATVVYEGDEFSYQLGTTPQIVHVPALTDTVSNNREITHAYAVAILKGGGKQFEVMDRGQLEAIRRRSMAKDSGPWVTDFEMMCRKTAIRRLVHCLPLSIDFHRAAAIDSGSESGTNDLSDFAHILEPDELGIIAGDTQKQLKSTSRKSALEKMAKDVAGISAQDERSGGASQQSPQEPALDMTRKEKIDCRANMGTDATAVLDGEKLCPQEVEHQRYVSEAICVNCNYRLDANGTPCPAWAE